MTDLFAEKVSVDDFALPTDADVIALKNAKATAAEPPAEPVVEEPAAVEPAAEETPPTDDRPRNPDGTFAAKDPVADEPVVVEEQRTGESHADYATSVAALEQRLADKDEFIGRLTNEVGESRKLLEQLAARADATPAAPPVQITQELIDTHPAYAAQLAYEQSQNDPGNQSLGRTFAIAFESWKEENEASALAWASAKHTEEQIAALRAENAQQLAEVRAQLGPVAQQTEEKRFTDAVSAVEKSIPGFKEFVVNEAAVLEAANEVPALAAAYASADPEGKADVLKSLFLVKRGRERDTLQATTEQVGRATAEEAQKVREESFVASATTAASGVKPSREDEIKAEWAAMEAPYNDGWNV